MDRQRRNAALWAGACALGLLAALQLFLHPWSEPETPPIQPADEEADLIEPPDTRLVAIGTTPPVAPEELPDETLHEPDELHRPRREPPCTVRLVSVQTKHARADESTVLAECRCVAEFRDEDTATVGVLDPGVVTGGETDRGARVYSEDKFQWVRPLLPGRRRAEFNLRAVVPADSAALSFLGGTVTRVISLGRESVTWDDPANQRGQTRSSAGFEFKLAGYERKGATGEVDIRFRVPPPGPGEPTYWAAKFIECELRCRDGSVLGLRSSSSAGVGEGGKWARKSYRCELDRRTPVAVVVSFVTAVVQEEVPFRLEDVRLPSPPDVPPALADRPRGPRGETTFTSEGYTFRLHEVEVKRTLRQGRKSGELTLRLKVRLPDDHKVVAAAHFASGAAAVDDKGTRLRRLRREDVLLMKRPWRRAKDFDQSLSTLGLSLPRDEADRLVSFSGRYRVYLAGGKSTVRFTIPPAPAEFAGPIKRGPVTLACVRHLDEEVDVSLEIEKNAFPTEDYWWVCGVRYELLDRAGSPFKVTGGGGSGGERHRKRITFRAEGRVPAELVVHYPAQCSVRDIPFRFENVGLPRRPGKYSYEEDVF